MNPFQGLKYIEENLTAEIKDMEMSGLVECYIDKNGKECVKLTKAVFEYAKKMYMTTPEQEKKFEEKQNE
jgi:hypothetical protein